MRDASSPWVFPGSGKRGHLVEMKRLTHRVATLSGVAFTNHDLPRTFATVAESLDLSPYAIKRLLNHKMRGDVTSGYIIFDRERLRAPVQKIADFLERALKAHESSNIITLGPRPTAVNPPIYRGNAGRIKVN